MTVASIVVTFLVTWTACAMLHADPSIAVLAAVVALGLRKRPERGEHVHIAIEAAGLILIGLVAAAAGLLLRWNLVAGAALFTVCVSLSVWLRGLHDDARVLGRVIALPFITILIAPVRPQAGAGALLLFAGPLVALVVSRFFARFSPAQPQIVTPPRKAGSLKPPAHVRMALQMFVALALAFIAGGLFFENHWPWIVLTAFIVCAGALGRADAIYKGLLRLGGAIGGGVIAAVVTVFVPANGPVDAAVIFAALFAGLALQARSYAYWAGATTLIFATLQRGESTFTFGLYLARLECILIGAACGIAAACLVFPLNTSDIVRRRIADVLGAIEAGSNESQNLHAAARELERLAGPLRLHRLMTLASKNNEHPLEWVDITQRLLLGPLPSNAGALRQARRAIRDQNGIAAALRSLSAEATTTRPADQR